MLRKQLRSFAALDLDSIFQEFYDSMLSNSDFSAFFKNEEQIKSLIQRQKKFFLETITLQDDQIKQRYIDLGEMHHEIGIPYVDYSAGMGILERGIARSVRSANRLDILDFSFHFFQKVNAFTAKGYLNKMLQQDVADIEMYLSHTKQGSELDTLIATEGIIWLKKLLLAIKAEDRKLVPVFVIPEEFVELIDSTSLTDPSLRMYIDDITSRIDLNATNLFFFLERGGYEEVLPLYYELMNIYKLTLILTSVVSMVKTNAAVEKLTTDTVTGLLTRQTFNAIMDRELSIASASHYEISLIMVDIDYFKKVNDSHGHPCGDRVLAGVASQLRSTIRTTDYGFRFGGDEIILVLKGASHEMALIQAELMRSKIEGLFFNSDTNDLFSVTASFGVSSYSPPFKLELADMIGASDKQLYLSKNAGRNRVN